MLRIYYSNQQEVLFEQLCSVVAQPLSNPLQTETIMVQSQGMAHWLSMELAQRLGIAANLDFPFPSSYVWRIFRQQYKDIPEQSRFDKPALRWRVMQALPDCLSQTGFESLQYYLRDDANGLKQYQLAQRIADIYDQYLIYRPDWLRAWEEGEEHHWQAQLWRQLSQGENEPHRARLYYRFMDDMQKGRIRSENLPQRISLFGISSLPQTYLEVIAGLSTVIDVHLFMLNPSMAYWGDIVSEKDLARLKRLLPESRRAELELYSVDNNLLASLGKQGRDYHEQLQMIGASLQVEEVEGFVEPLNNQSLLQKIQRDILFLQQGDADDAQITAEDRSIQIHSCHSRMREVEVLHDQLLAMFDTDPQLQAQDVVVLSPDIEEYAPYIQAVFGTASSEQHIPWSIADQSLQAEHPLLALFIELLSLFKSRFNVSQVLNLLENPSVQAHLQIDEDELETLRHWIHDSGIRWGFNEHSRAGEGLPGFEQNSWQFGLRRMLLGYSLPDREGSYRSYTPYSPVFGQQAVLLGKLQTFIQQLQQYQNQFSQSYSLSQWTQLLQHMVDDFFQASDEDERNALQVIRDLCSRLDEESQLASYADSVSLDVMIQELQGHLSQTGANHRFMTGQVTFCTMVPMRSIPYKVVCLLGMGDQYYPRRVKQMNFDLMQHDVRKGDRSRREDDRYLFLESLLAARQVFYISYVGRSLQDNAPYLPSVVVDELTDYIQRHYCSDKGELLQQLVIEHPMQAFSEQYTAADNPLFTYQAQWFSDLQQRQPFVFMDQPLPASVFVHEQVSLDDLINFFSDPIRWTLQQRMQMRLHATQDELDDHEPFAGDSLLRYQVSQPLLQRLLRDQPVDDYLQAMQHSGKLPMGILGERLLQGWQQDMQTMVAQIQEQLPHIHYQPRELDVAIGATRVLGWLNQYDDQGVVRVRAANLNARDRLRLWLEHLLWCSAEPKADARALGFARDRQYRYQAVDNAPEILGQLLEIYRQGQNEILHFYPKTSYLQAVGEKAEKVTQSWMSFDFTRHSQGEGQRLDYQMALAGHEPLDEQFVDLAQRIYQPLLDHLQEEKL